MVEKNKLIIGNYYYTALYYSEKHKISDIKTYVYIGKNMFTNVAAPDSDSYAFQEAKSYHKNGPYTPNGKVSLKKIFVTDADSLPIVLDLDGLIAHLTALRERLAKAKKN